LGDDCEEKENVIVEKSKSFALRIIRFCRYLCGEKNEYILSKQLLRSGTSIGANVKEAVRGQSKADFYAKMNISLLKRQVKQNIGWNCCMKAGTSQKSHLSVSMRIVRS